MRDTKRHICTIAIRNSWNTIFQLFFDEHDGKFNFKGNLLIRSPKPVELSQEWVLEYFKYREPSFYPRLFVNYEEVPFEVPPGCIMFCVINKPIPATPKIYVWRKEIVLVCFVRSLYIFSYWWQSFSR